MYAMLATKNYLLYFTKTFGCQHQTLKKEGSNYCLLASQEIHPHQLGCGNVHVMVPEHRKEGAGWNTLPAGVKLRQCDNISTAKYVWEEPAYLGLYSN